MNIMDYIFFEISDILYLQNRLNAESTAAEIETINETIAEQENDMLGFCSQEDLELAKSEYEKEIESGKTTGIFGVSLTDALKYIEELIAKKKKEGNNNANFNTR